MLPPKGSRVLVAVSGGVDSAVAAAILVERGCECTGATLRLAPEDAAPPPGGPGGLSEAVDDARRVCQTLGIPHEEVNAVDLFDREVIANFIDEYRRGRTPNPCIRCNRLIKFGALYERADALRAPYVATGHYARLEHKAGRLAVRRAADLAKDQSYVLAPLAQSQLERACFPLGELTKTEVRRRAELLDLGLASRHESQDICFLPGQHYGAFVEHRAGSAAPGPIVTAAGKTIGRHRGLLHYTIGQRRGLGIGGAEGPYYVVALDVQNNTLVVGHEADTYCAEFTTEALCWAGISPQTTPLECLVQLHSQHTPAPATLYPGTDRARVRLHRPQRSVTPGQWAVCYGEDHVLCAGIIDAFTRSSP